MALEAVGTASAIIQLAGVGLELAKTMYRVSDEISSAEKQIKELAFYVRSTSVILEEVGKIFEEEGASAKPLISKNAITTANDVVARCKVIFEKLDKVAKETRKNPFSSVKFVLMSSRHQRLQTGLEQSKSDLQLMMQIIIYARVKVETWEPTNDTDLKKALQRLIDENKAVHKKHFQAQDQEEDQEDQREKTKLMQQSHTYACRDTIQSPHISVQTISSSYQPKDTLTTDKIVRRGRSSLPPEMLPGPEAARSASPQAIRHSQQENTDQDECYKDDLSYWFALYLVCCPCLARKRKHQRRTDKLQTKAHELDDIPLNTMKIGCAKSASVDQYPCSKRTFNDERYHIGSWADCSQLVYPPRFITSTELDRTEVDKLLEVWTTIYDAIDLSVNS